MSDLGDRDEPVVDERLRADAARWRAVQPLPPEPDLDRLARGAAGPPGIRWQPLAAAAAAAVLLAGGVGAIAAALAHPSVDPGDIALMPPAARPQPSLNQLVVHDGNLAAASGQVVAVAGRPVRFCAPVPSTGVGYAEGKQPPAAYCEAGVTLLGADLGRLTGRTERDGVVWGSAWIEGTFRAGTLTVTRQGAPRPPVAPAPSFPGRPPCAAPSGGWAGGDLNGGGADGGDLSRLSGYLADHPDRYGEIVVTYPDGPPAGPTDGPGYTTKQVALVGTVADPAAAYRELRTVFTGNLCVTRVPRSRIQVDAVLQRVLPLERWHLQVYTAGPDYFAGRVQLDLVVLDQPRYQALAEADRGTGIVLASPWLLRVR